MKAYNRTPARFDCRWGGPHGSWESTGRAHLGDFPPLVALVVSLTALLIGLPPPGQASANGNAVEIFRGRQGAYEVVVRVLPEKPAVGAVHLSITPLEQATMSPVYDAEIIIVAYDPQGRPTYQARALNLPDSPELYEANIRFESAGRWSLRVLIRTDALGEATVTAPLEVQEQAIPPGTWGGFVFLGVFAVLVVGGLYLWYSVRRRRTEAQA